MVKKLISVDGELWKRVKGAAGERGLTLSETVDTALSRWLAAGAPMPPAETLDARRLGLPRPTSAQTIAPVPAAPRSEDRCVCGERREFHSLGQSGTYAKNGCRRFREA